MNSLNFSRILLSSTLFKIASPFDKNAKKSVLPIVTFFDFFGRFLYFVAYQVNFFTIFLVFYKFFEKSIEYFYLCEWISGEFGTGVGEEFDVNSNKEGVYIPKLIEIKDIPNLPLMPAEIADLFYEDYKSNGLKIRDDIKHILIDNNARG